MASSQNTNLKMILGGLLLLVLLVAVIWSVVASRKKDPDAGTSANQTPGASTQTSAEPSGETEPEPTVSPEGTASIQSEPPSTSQPVSQVSSISLSKSDFSMFSIGETVTVTATVVPASSGQTVKWEIADTSVAMVDQNGKVTAVNKGDTKLTASIGDVKATCEVRVKATASGNSNVGTNASFKLSHTDVTLSASGVERYGKSFTLSVTGATGSAVYSTGNSNVATVDGAGKVTAVGEGSATITVTVNGESQTCKIIVRS